MVLIFFCLAGAALLFSASFMLPIIVALAHHEFNFAFRMLIYCIFFCFLSGTILLASYKKKSQLPKSGGLYLVILGWCLFPFIAAMPMADIIELDFIDAYFEAVSGLTTTGSTVLTDTQKIPKAMLIYRSQLEWIGGLYTLLTFVLFLGPLSIGGLPGYQISRQAGNFFATPQRSLQAMVKISLFYILLTFICISTLLLVGTDLFHAFIFTTVSVSTGGFLPPGTLIQEYSNQLGMIVMSIFFIIGATSILWHRMILRRKWYEFIQHRESYWIIGVIGVLSVLFCVQLLKSSGIDVRQVGFLKLVDVVVESIFNATSMVTTSGIQSRPGIFALLPFSLVFFVILIGGGSFSTAGGLKYFRVGSMYNQSLFELNQLIYPHKIRPRYIGNLSFNIEFMKSIFSFFFATIIIVTIGIFLLTATSLGFEAAVFATIAAISNAGPAYSPEWVSIADHGWPPYSQMLWQSKLILCILMLLGRLEILVFLVIFAIVRLQI